MNEAQATSLVIEYLALVHTYGEAIWGRVDLWIGASFGMILLGYFAPERLKPAITTLILSLYILFSVSLYNNLTTDTVMADAVMQDALELAQTHGLDLNTLAAINNASGYTNHTMVMFLAGLFIGTLGFLLSVCVMNIRTQKAGN